MTASVVPVELLSPAGTLAAWDRINRRVYCQSCADSGFASLGIDAGTPGGSLEREYERRRQHRDQRVWERFPRAGGLILALTHEPASTTAFARGAEGERRIAARLETLCGDDALFLHNRRLGRAARRGDVDHVAVTSSGVYVVDAKHYKGAKVSVRRTGGLVRPAREQLMIRGRDRTTLVDSLNRQFVAVAEAVGDMRVPVTALFCFIDAELPVIVKLSVSGIPILGPRGTSKLLRRPGPVTPQQRRALWERLASALPPA